MKSKFSEQDLKERTLELLYGLLEEDEAEELRRLIASDAVAARIFDEARETADRFARAARWEVAPEADVDETAAKNVAVESAPFDGGAALALDSAFIGDALAATDDAETSDGDAANVPETSGSNRKRAKRRLNLLRKLKTTSKNERSEIDVKTGERGGLRKESRRGKTGKPANAALPAPASRFRFGANEGVDDASGWATVGRTSSGKGGRRSAARRLLARVPKPTLFQNLIIALAVVAFSTAVGFWAQESALQARFRDDFRIQIAAPRTLARGESQTISATTTAPNGKPRRVPIRFAFSDAETGAPLLAHTESGDASGVARFKIPDVSDFPARTLLTISAGEREKETFETILTVVDAPQEKRGASAAARFAASETVGEISSLNLGARQSVAADALYRKSASRAMSANVAPLAAPPEDADVETEREPWRSLPGTPDALSMNDGTMGAPMGGGMSMGDGTMGGGMMGVGTMGAPMGGDTMGASTLEPKAASRKARTETVVLADQGAPEFARALNDDVQTFALDDESSADFAFSLSPRISASDDKKETTPDGAEPAFNFAVAFNDVGPTEVAGMNATIAAEKGGLDVRFYPTGGRLVAGRENVVWFECVDADGRPVVGEFALNDSTGRVATAKTSEGGVGSLRWTPDVDETYSLETAFDGGIATIVETDKNDKADEASAEMAIERFKSASRFKTFRFPAPTATVERVGFSVPSRVLEREQGVELEVWCENDIPLAATVEKNGVALAQRVWTAKKGRRRVVVPLDADVSGALNVSLWNCARTPFERVGSAAVYRKSTDAPTLAATLERNEAGERALRIAVERQKSGEIEEPVWLKAFWAPTLDEALAELELDETLLYASDERRAETLATLEPSPAAEPVLFDNLLEMKESALEKLNAFWLGEAGLAGRVVGLGFVGCGALALLTVFCVVFGALKARRGAVVVLFCAALATFFYFERRRIDFSETLTQAIAVSVDESKAARQRDATAANAPKTVANETTATTNDGRGTCALFWLEREAKPANAAEWSAALPKALAESGVGFVLAKVFANDGTLFAWKAIPLAESDGEETE